MTPTSIIFRKQRDLDLIIKAQMQSALGLIKNRIAKRKDLRKVNLCIFALDDRNSDSLSGR
jgi:hypothetical protein